MLSFLDTFRFMAIIFVLVLPLLLLLKRARPGESGNTGALIESDRIIHSV